MCKSGRKYKKISRLEGIQKIARATGEKYF